MMQLEHLKLSMKMIRQVETRVRMAPLLRLTTGDWTYTPATDFNNGNDFFLVKFTQNNALALKPYKLSIYL